MDNQRMDEPKGPWANPRKGGPWELFFVENMRRLRERNKMTQTDLAKTLKARGGLPFHQQTIQRIENGERPVRLNEAFVIAEVLDVDLETMVSHIITDEEEISIEIERITRKGSNAAEALLEEYFQFIESVEVFAFAVLALVPKIEVGSDRKPVNSNAQRFRQLPYNVQIGLALCLKLRDMGLKLGDLWLEFAKYFGDPNGERREDLWEFKTPEIEVFCDIGAVIHEWDCEELQELSSQTLNHLFVESFKSSRNASAGRNTEGRDVPHSASKVQFIDEGSPEAQQFEAERQKGIAEAVAQANERDRARAERQN